MDCTSDFIQICMPSFCRTGFELFQSCGSENIFSLVVGSNGKLLCVSKTSGRTASGYLNLSIGLRPKCSCYGSRSPRGPCLDSCSRIRSRLSVQSYVWETLSKMVCKNRDRWWSHNLILQKPLDSGRVFFQRSWFCVRKNLLGLDKLFVRRTTLIGIEPDSPMHYNPPP